MAPTPPITAEPVHACFNSRSPNCIVLPLQLFPYIRLLRDYAILNPSIGTATATASTHTRTGFVEPLCSAASLLLEYMDRAAAFHVLERLLSSEKFGGLSELFDPASPLLDEFIFVYAQHPRPACNRIFAPDMNGWPHAFARA